MSDTTRTSRALILATQGARLTRMYAASPTLATASRKRTAGQMRIEGQRAMVRLYERFGSNKVTLDAMRETLRRMVARSYAAASLEANTFRSAVASMDAQEVRAPMTLPSYSAGFFTRRQAS